MPLLESTRVENLLRSCRTARWSWDTFDAIAETSQFADHLARSHLLRLCADRWSAFLVPNALVKNLPNETTEPVGDGPDGLSVPEAWDEPSIDDREDRALGLRRRVCSLIDDAPHLAVALGTAVAVVHSGTRL